MSKNHTPGPWVPKQHFRNELVTREGLTVVVCVRSRKEWPANLKLIAAAPEMLEALEYVIDLNDRLFELSLSEYQRDLWVPRIEKIRAAIALATL